MVYSYLLADVDYKSNETKHENYMRTVKTSEMELNVPKSFTLGAAFPNPFNPSFTLPLTLDQQGDVSIDLFNSNGQWVKTIAAGSFNAGSHMLSVDAAHLATGVYLVSCNIGHERMTQKVVLMK